MTVGELIKLLETHDKDKEVVYTQCSDTWGSISDAYEDEDRSHHYNRLPGKKIYVVLV